mmetsp:Transcript_1087/g.1071  ORF Transcript_1087/g.1071 Transcript_1087/m.1071 type:complete len:104 (+) Transcript_1087:84-395(+)
MQIESAFISRISYEPFKIPQIYRNKNEIFGEWLKERLQNITYATTCLYMHPCYIINIIKQELLPDSLIYSMITELYEYETSLRVNFLISLTLAVLKRDNENEK